MAGNSFGEIFRITTFGESHGGAVGVVVDGCPPGLAISTADIQAQLDRRKPGQSDITTPRKEEDTIHILSGVFEGVTTELLSFSSRTTKTCALRITITLSGCFAPLTLILPTSRNTASETIAEVGEPPREKHSVVWRPALSR